MNKKTQGWILIAVLSPLALIFLIGTVALIPELFQNASTHKGAAANNITMMLLQLIILFALLFGIKRGIKLIKKPSETLVIPFEKTLNIHFSGKLSLEDYRKINFRLILKKPISMYVILIGIITCFGALMRLFSNEPIDNSHLVQFILPVLFVLIPFSIFFQSKKQYESNKYFHQELSYQLSNEHLAIQGDSIEVKIKWSYFIKLEDLGDFYILYQTNSLATILDKRLFKENDLIEFNEFIRSLKFQDKKEG